MKLSRTIGWMAVALGVGAVAFAQLNDAPPPRDLRIDFDLHFDRCINRPHSSHCPAGGALGLVNDGSVYAGAVLTLTNRCHATASGPHCKLKGTLTPTLYEPGELPDHNLAFSLDTGDVCVAEIPLHRFLDVLPTGGALPVRVKLPKHMDVTGWRLLAVVDNQNAIPEADETNNASASQPIP